jgi:hypothetical protein
LKRGSQHIERITDLPFLKGVEKLLSTFQIDACPKDRAWEVVELIFIDL